MISLWRKEIREDFLKERTFDTQLCLLGTYCVPGSAGRGGLGMYKKGLGKITGGYRELTFTVTLRCADSVLVLYPDGPVSSSQPLCRRKPSITPPWSCYHPYTDTGFTSLCSSSSC